MKDRDSPKGNNVNSRGFHPRTRMSVGIITTLNGSNKIHGERKNGSTLFRVVKIMDAS